MSLKRGSPVSFWIKKKVMNGEKMKSYPKVSIVILNWNGLDDTIECLESLKKITYPNYEVIVVDNGSKGNDVQVLQERFGDYIHLIKNDKNYGFAKGANIGMTYALNNSAPDYVLLLNNDTVVDPEFLTEMVKAAQADLAIGIIGPKTYYYNQPNKIQLTWNRIDLWRGRVFLAGAGEIDRGQHNEDRETDYVPGSCFLVKRETLGKIGLFDAAYFCYGEESDYCMRAKRAGYRLVYYPKAKVWHKVSSTAKKITGLFEYYSTRNRFWFMKKYATKLQFFSFVLWFFLFEFWFVSGSLLIHHRHIKLLRCFYKGIKDGLLMLIRQTQAYLLYISVLHYANFAKVIEARIVAKLLDVRAGEKVCDVACGSGHEAIRTAKSECSVCGVDMSGQAVQTAKLLTQGRNSSFVTGDAENLPWKSGIFDKTTCICALEHFKDDERALREMNRVLKLDGILVLTVDSFTYKGISTHLREVHKNWGKVVNYYTRSELKKKLDEAGFHLEESRYFVNSPVSSFFIKAAIRLRFGCPFLISFPLTYPLTILSDRLWARKNEGYFLAVKAKKVKDIKR